MIAYGAVACAVTGVLYIIEPASPIQALVLGAVWPATLLGVVVLGRVYGNG
jgi:hypothetical protein